MFYETSKNNFLREKILIEKITKNKTSDAKLKKIEIKKDDLFLIEDMIVKNGRNIILGYWGQGKTWFSLMLAKAIAYEETFGNKKVYENKKVFYFSFEEKETSLSHKLKLLSFPEEEKVQFYVGSGGLVSSEDQVKMLSMFLKENDYEIVFFDTLRKLHSLDENSSTQMSYLFEWINEYLNQKGITTVFIHHKAKKSNESSGEIPASMSGRGSSEIVADVDSILMVKKVASLDKLTLLVSQDKNRYGKEEEGWKIECEFPTYTISPFSFTQNKTQMLVNYINLVITNEGEIDKKEILAYGQSLGLSIWTINDIVMGLCNKNYLKRIKKGREVSYVFGEGVLDEVGN